MKSKIIKETVIPFILVVLALCLLDPFNFWMSDMATIGILLALLVLFSVFATFILKEKAYDEREEKNRSLAGRNAFLFGAGILLLGIVIEGYMHSVDPWLVVALTVMILAKIATRIWSDKNL